nr:hypothetical protein [uncultured Pseudogulbenkiania sp.]
MEMIETKTAKFILVREFEAIESLHNKGFSYKEIIEKLNKLEDVNITWNDFNNYKRKMKKQTKPIENKTTMNTQPTPKTFTPSVKTEARKEEKLTTIEDKKCVSNADEKLFYFEGEDINSVKFIKNHVDSYEQFMKYLADNFDENFFNSYAWDWEKYTPMRYFKQDDFRNEKPNFLTEKDFIQTCVFYAGNRSKKLDKSLLDFPLGNVLNNRMEVHKHKNRDGKDNFIKTYGPL